MTWLESDLAFADWLDRFQASPSWSPHELRIVLDAPAQAWADAEQQAWRDAVNELIADRDRERAGFTARMEQVGMRILTRQETS